MSTAARRMGCPEDARSAGDMLTQLILVNAVVIPAYIHLLTLRNEPHRYLRAFILFLVPIGAFWHVVVPLGTLAVWILLHRLDFAEAVTGFSLLFGRLPDAESALHADRLDKGVSSPAISRASAPIVLQSARTFSRAAYARLALYVLLCIQSAAWIHLSVRRFQAGASSAADNHVFHLAIASACTSGQLLVQHLVDPRAPDAYSPRGLQILLRAVRGVPSPVNRRVVWLTPLRDVLGTAIVVWVTAVARLPSTYNHRFIGFFEGHYVGHFFTSWPVGPALAVTTVLGSAGAMQELVRSGPRATLRICIYGVAVAVVLIVGTQMAIVTGLMIGTAFEDLVKVGGDVAILVRDEPGRCPHWAWRDAQGILGWGLVARWLS